MLKKHVTFYLVLGIVAGLFLTACAGVVTGRVDMPVGGTTLLGPAVDIWQAPALDFLRPEVMHFKSEQAVRAQVQEMLQSGHWCNGGD